MPPLFGVVAECGKESDSFRRGFPNFPSMIHLSTADHKEFLLFSAA